MNEIIPAQDVSAIMEHVLIKGDLSKLTPEQRNTYYMQTCASLGMNPLTRPFEYLILNGKTTLYARRDAADQLRKINGVNIEIIDQHDDGGMYFVTVRATDKTGRIDTDMGVVALPQGSGDIKANAVLKCITKAKRRVTLSICGLGFLDETEVEDIPAHAKQRPAPMKQVTATPAAANATSSSQAAGPSAPSTEKPFDSAEGADTPLDDVEQQIDQALASAAAKGMDALKTEWKATHPRYQKILRERLDTVHKPAAEKVTA